jgi:hypothetical protein
MAQLDPYGNTRRIFPSGGCDNSRNSNNRAVGVRVYPDWRYENEVRLVITPVPSDFSYVQAGFGSRQKYLAFLTGLSSVDKYYSIFLFLYDKEQQKDYFEHQRNQKNIWGATLLTFVSLIWIAFRGILEESEKNLGFFFTAAKSFIILTHICSHLFIFTNIADRFKESLLAYIDIEHVLFMKKLTEYMVFDYFNIESSMLVCLGFSLVKHISAIYDPVYAHAANLLPYLYLTHTSNLRPYLYLPHIGNLRP